MKKGIVLFGLLILSVYIHADMVYNVKEFGASGDRKELQTSSLQKAIDACHTDGGGTVYFPAGEYLSATLQLKDNVTLYLSTGARLVATDEKEQYTVRTQIADTGSQGTPMLLYAKGAKNISIKGEGEIVAQPQYYSVPLTYSDFIADDIAAAEKAHVEMIAWRWKEPNVTLVYLSECKDVHVSGVRLLDSAFWTLHIHWCDRVQINGIYIYSNLEKGVNADGIDIDGSKNVTISDCIIETADDAICLKTTKNESGYRNCENVTVTNCVLTSSSAALKLGTESHGDFRYINFYNCIIRNTNRAFGIFIRDGGCAEHIVFSDIQIECTRRTVGWWGSADAFRFVVLKRNATSKIGAIKDILIKNVNANVEGTSLIAGYEGTQNVTNIKLENVRLTMHSESLPDKRAAEGLAVKNARDVSMYNSSVIWQDSTEASPWTHALSFQNVSAVVLDNMKLNSSSKAYTPLFFLDCDDIYIERSLFDVKKKNVFNSEGRIENVRMGYLNRYN